MKTKFRVLKTKKIWVSELTCSKCGTKEIHHHFGKNKKDAKRDFPSHSWNGWKIKEKLCPVCANEKMSNVFI